MTQPTLWRLCRCASRNSRRRTSISHSELLERSNLSGLELAPSGQGRGRLALQIGEHGLVLRSRRRIAGTHERPQRRQHVVETDRIVQRVLRGVRARLDQNLLNLGQLAVEG